MARLLALVSVSRERAVRCGEVCCGHSVHAAVHVVEDEGKLLVLGSTCFAKRYGSAAALGEPSYGSGSGSGRSLSEAERQMLIDNTAALLAQFEEEKQRQLAMRSAALQEKRKPATSASQPAFGLHLNRSPWPWVKPLTSMAYFHLQDGSNWVRVQHRDQRQILVPWPAFDGWDEALPPTLGSPDHELGGYVLGNLVNAVAYLRSQGGEPRVGVWEQVRLFAD